MSEFDEISSRTQEEACLLPTATVLASEKRTSLAMRQLQAFKLKKCVAHICEAPVHVKSFIRQTAGKNSKFVYTLFAERSSQRMGRRSLTSTAADTGLMYDLSLLTRRSKLLYFV